MAVHVHEMTRLDVGPPKQYVCAVAGCDHKEPVSKPEPIAETPQPEPTGPEAPSRPRR